MKHTITVTFETDDNLSDHNMILIEAVTEDMRAQLETLADATDQNGNWVGMDYYNAKTEYKNDLDTKIDQVILEKSILYGICSCELCQAYSQDNDSFSLPSR
jgi:hypothetical protein